MERVIICPHCGNRFLLNKQSIYKLTKNGKVVYYCSYKCWVANDNRKYNFIEGRFTH